MFLMIFVNDLWSLVSYPEWLGHATATEDRLGFSDIIFPVFLFIVGLSIPLAIDRRFQKGDGHFQVIWHILLRTLALITMGFYMVNFENIGRSELPISAGLWEILMAVAIFLIWTNYPDKKAFGKIPERYMQVAGLLVLFGLAFIYRGSDGSESMQTHWWGILGLIGWAYLYVALVYLGVGKRLFWLLLVFLMFNFLNVNEFLTRDYGWVKIHLLESASNYTLVMGGTLVSVLLTNLKEKWFLAALITLGILWMAYGVLLRPYWGISKIQATPSWTAITGGISCLVFGLLYLIADKLKWTSWAKPLAPAGRSTLTAYVIPYIYYPIAAWVGFQLPEAFRTGLPGVIKCLLFAALIILLTRLLEILKIRLKV